MFACGTHAHSVRSIDRSRYPIAIGSLCVSQDVCFLARAALIFFLRTVLSCTSFRCQPFCAIQSNPLSKLLFCCSSQTITDKQRCQMAVYRFGNESEPSRASRVGDDAFYQTNRIRAQRCPHNVGGSVRPNSVNRTKKQWLENEPCTDAHKHKTRTNES